MNENLFARLCDELGYDPSTVLIIRISSRTADVTYTEPSGMPRGSAHALQSDIDKAA